MQIEVFPGVLGEIAEVAGKEAALKLSAAYGGTRVSFPFKLSPDQQWLIDCVGQEAAEAICNYFGVIPATGRGCGAYLEIPRGGFAIIEFHKKIINLSHDGYSAREIALMLGTTERRVYRIRAKYRDSSSQPKTRSSTDKR